MPKVLVLDANQRSALAIIRSLGRRGLSVIAGDTMPKTLGAASRYASASIIYPDPAASHEAFVSAILDTAGRLGIDTVIPATDLTTMLLVSQPRLSEIAHVATPEAAGYEMLTDKARLVALASTLDIPVPETRIVRTLPEAERAANELGFPAVLKPARSRYLKGKQVVSTGVEIVEDRRQLTDALSRQRWLGDIPCLVQRFVPGHGAGVFALFGPSGPIAWFAHRRLREKPPTGGVSVLCESVPIDPAMQSAAARLLSAANWTGVAMVEFRVGADGTHYLMEVNGRFWGSLQLAVDCGVDFPWLLYQITQRAPLDPIAPYTVGKRLRWLLGDVDSLLITLRRVPGRADKIRALWVFLRSFTDPSCRQEVLRLSDLSPGLREIRQWTAALHHAH